MPAVTRDITIEQGASYQMRLRWKPAGEETWPDLTTGFQGWFTVRKGSTGDVWVEADSETGNVTFTDDGWVIVNLTDEDTSDLEALPNLRYNLLVETPTGDRKRLAQGKATLDVEVPIP